ncbi:MAG: hypothetical protein ACFFAE_04935, partial [Candidatus Hodarchaeota archaeon]
EIRMNHSNAQGVLLRDNVATFDWGFSVIINLPPFTPLEDGIMIYGVDPTPPPLRERREGYNFTRVITTIDLSNYAVDESHVFVGENVTISGRLFDDRNSPIDSTVPIFTPSFLELTNSLRFIGWNGTHEIGVAEVVSPIFNGTYSMSYRIPFNYTDDTLSIRLNITSPGLIHYRVNYTEWSIDVYRDYILSNVQFELTNGSVIAIINNNSVFVINEAGSQNIIVSGFLQDSIGRGLDGKSINYVWNGTSTPSTAQTGGAFTYTSPTFSMFNNDTYIWQFYHILDNGTTLTNHSVVTFQWEVYDTTGPSITINNPSETLLPPSDIIDITVTVIEPTFNVVYVGLDNTSVTVQINGAIYPMSQINLTTFFYTWDTSSSVDQNYTIRISASDWANNGGTAEIDVVIDIIAPTGTINVPKNNEGYLVVDSNGYVVITGTAEDTNSITGLNFGIDNESARLFIINSQTDDIVINESIFINENLYSYEWGIILDPDDIQLLRREVIFSGYEDWTINVTFSDLAGNDGNTTLNVKLDNISPDLEFIDELPEVVDEEIIITVSFDDQETGIFPGTLTFELLTSNNSILEVFTGPDINVEDSRAILILDTSKIDEGSYSIRVQVHDNTGNKQVRVSDPFLIDHPSPPNPFANIILIILSPILAFGGGIGLAALYERVKGLRGV